MTRSRARLEQDAETPDKKTATQPDLTPGLKAAVRRRARNTAAGLPDPVRDQLRSILAVRRRAQQVKQILAAQAFDQQWYEAQTGQTFRSIAAACQHYLREGRRTGLSPHPLFEPTLVEPIRWPRVRILEPLISNLRGRPGRGPSVHLTIPRSMAYSAPGRRPGWIEWARKAQDSTPMPSQFEGQVPPTWEVFRRRAIEIAAAQRPTEDLINAPRIVVDRPPEAAKRKNRRAADVTSDGASPLVSVVMPTWNRAGMLRDAIASVQAQTFQDWELIVVDDGSDDDTLLVLEGIQRLDERIRVVAEAHHGVCRARNVAIEHAKGKYLAFLDTDNVWNINFLDSATKFAAAENVRWAHAAMQLERASCTFFRSFEGDLEHLLVANYIDLNVLIAERDTIVEVGGFDESLRRAVDYDLVLRLARSSPPRLIPAIGAVYADDSADDSRISVTEPVAWDQVVRVRHLVDVAVAAAKPTVSGRVSVVLPLREITGTTIATIDGLLAEPGDIELIVLTSGAVRAVARMVELAGLSRPRMAVVDWPGANLDLAASLDLAATHATGDHLVLWQPGHVPHLGWLQPLLETLGDSDVAVVQPLVLRHNGTISSAGAVFVDRDPHPSALLGGYPVEDSAPLTTSTVPAALSGVIMLRTADFWRLGGVDPLFGNAFGEVDLALRAADEGLGCTRLVTRSVVTSHEEEHGFVRDVAASVDVLRRRHVAPSGSEQLWHSVGFEQIGRRSELLESPDEESEVLGAVPVVRPAVELVTEGAPRLRWALDTAAPAGARGLAWGDVHFADALARSLTRLGQHVHVDRREARDGDHRDVDDVTLVVRGLDLVVPRPGGVSMLWVISHPDLVTANECATFGHVFAASTDWSARMSQRWGLTVDPLLQCTDAHLFRPDAAAPDSAADVVFVGNSRKIYRSSVKHAVAAGLTPDVYGAGWENLVPKELIRGQYFPNAELPALYAGSGAVLNDHWDDMRHDGFISNRVFDVLACGGRLVTDDVAGLTELFGDAVTIFRSQGDMQRLFAGDWRSRFPSVDTRRRVADVVRSEHTFDARARTLLDAALSLRTGSGIKPDTRTSA